MVVSEQKSRQAELDTFDREEKRQNQNIQGVIVRGKKSYFQVYWKVPKLNFVLLHSQKIAVCACMGGPSWKGCTSAH